MKKSYRVRGMHCNSCAVNIEGELEGKVNSVKVNYSKEEAEIDFNPEKISEEEIKESIKKLGYELIESKNKKEKAEIKNKTGWIVVSVSLILFLAVLYFTIGKNIHLPEIPLPNIGEQTSLILLFAAGLLVGFHCVSMCGGFVVSYTAKNAIEGKKNFGQHLAYGGSKVISYTIIGALFGLVGGFFVFSTKLRGIVAILAGAFMVFYALSMFGIGFFKKFQFNPKFLMKAGIKASQNAKGRYRRPIFTGLLNGLFIACGPLQAMYLYAAGTGSLISGAESLAAFGLGTIPVMIGFGSLATAISYKTTKKILKVSAVIVLILGLVMLNRGLVLAGSSVNFDSIKSGVMGTGNVVANSNSGNSANVVQGNGVQEVNMDVDASGYHPNSFVIKPNVPVKWNINVQELTSCNSELVMNEYGIDIHLKQGINNVNFTPTKEETIQFSCGMGMLHGSFIVTKTGTATQQEIADATPSAGSSCGCGG